MMPLVSARLHDLTRQSICITHPGGKSRISQTSSALRSIYLTKADALLPDESQAAVGVTSDFADEGKSVPLGAFKV